MALVIVRVEVLVLIKNCSAVFLASLPPISVVGTL